MKITVTKSSRNTPPIGWSHHGLHLKRSLGGPPWWKYINGFSFWLPRGSRAVWGRMVWVEFWKAHRTGKFFEDRSGK